MLDYNCYLNARGLVNVLRSELFNRDMYDEVSGSNLVALSVLAQLYNGAADTLIGPDEGEWQYVRFHDYGEVQANDYSLRLSFCSYTSITDTGVPDTNVDPDPDPVLKGHNLAVLEGWANGVLHNEVSGRTLFNKMLRSKREYMQRFNRLIRCDADTDLYRQLHSLSVLDLIVMMLGDYLTICVNNALALGLEYGILDYYDNEWIKWWQDRGQGPDVVSAGYLVRCYVFSWNSLCDTYESTVKALGYASSKSVSIAGMAGAYDRCDEWLGARLRSELESGSGSGKRLSEEMVECASNFCREVLLACAMLQSKVLVVRENDGIWKQFEKESRETGSKYINAVLKRSDTIKHNLAAITKDYDQAARLFGGDDSEAMCDWWGCVLRMIQGVHNRRTKRLSWGCGGVLYNPNAGKGRGGARDRKGVINPLYDVYTAVYDLYVLAWVGRGRGRGRGSGGGTDTCLLNHLIGSARDRLVTAVRRWAYDSVQGHSLRANYNSSNGTWMARYRWIQSVRDALFDLSNY